ncbi:hypothetical protein [Actinoplanes awajinensis]|uniref:hypothetical protein n=1 Tax=Actinoplanes awajinensis TaxID=135946 RepID=UPI000AEAE222|nr:hypothetical protein [Actinoplanes awajinensis]
MRSVLVQAPDGSMWQVFRRRVAWRPWLPRRVSKMLFLPDAGDNIIGLLALVLSLICVVLVSPVLLWYGAWWLCSLAATPFVASARKNGSKPTPVVARPRSDARREHLGHAPGFAAAENLVLQVAHEIRTSGHPHSLQAAGPG